jgi:hypothetical protein
MSFSAGRDGAKQAHSITGELPVHFVPKFASILVPFHRPDRVREANGIRQLPDQWREVYLI